jgi:hypothetical protein
VLLLVPLYIRPGYKCSTPTRNLPDNYKSNCSTTRTHIRHISQQFESFTTSSSQSRVRRPKAAVRVFHRGSVVSPLGWCSRILDLSKASLPLVRNGGVQKLSPTLMQPMQQRPTLCVHVSYENYTIIFLFSLVASPGENDLFLSCIVH